MTGTCSPYDLPSSSYFSLAAAVPTSGIHTNLLPRCSLVFLHLHQLGWSIPSFLSFPCFLPCFFVYSLFPFPFLLLLPLLASFSSSLFPSASALFPPPPTPHFLSLLSCLAVPRYCFPSTTATSNGSPEQRTVRRRVLARNTVHPVGRYIYLLGLRWSTSALACRSRRSCRRGRQEPQYQR